MTSYRICLSLSDLLHLAQCPPVHLCCYKWQNFILFYDWVIVQYFMPDIQCIFFIPSSIDEILACFHTLEIVNSAAMNTEVHVSFWISGFFFFIYWVLYLYKRGDREPEMKGLAQGHSASPWSWWFLNLGHQVSKLMFCVSVSRHCNKQSPSFSGWKEQRLISYFCYMSNKGCTEPPFITVTLFIWVTWVTEQPPSWILPVAGQRERELWRVCCI